MFIQMEVFVWGDVKANDAVKLSKECFLDHDRCPVDLTFIKVDFGFILMLPSQLAGYPWRVEVLTFTYVQSRVCR